MTPARDRAPQNRSPAQQAAIAHVRSLAAERAASTRATLLALEAHGLTHEALDGLMAAVRAHARVMIHFHPDRLSRGGRPVAEALFEDGLFRTQFETGLSAGALTAYPGGSRDVWEERLFGGAYQAPDVALSERPKYGALALLDHADGPAPRFGACYFVLGAEVSARCSYTYGGSQSPETLACSGTLDAMEPVLVALFEDVVRDRGALGVADVDLGGFVSHLTRALSTPYAGLRSRRHGRSLDSFVEAQIHGPVSLAHDVDWLVADPAFAGTPTGRTLERLCETYGIQLAWHPGFAMRPEAVPAEFRGPAIPPLARRIAGDRVFDVATIGAAEASLRREPEAWRDWGEFADTLQHLKQLWHVLVRYGEPARPGA